MKRRSVLLVSTVLLLLCHAALRAEVLEGKIFLGPGLGLFLEKDEGLFRSMLRALALVDGEIPVLDLTALEISRNHLFLGEDGNLYLRDQDLGSIHRVGRWTGPDQINLDPGVVLEVTRTNSEIFEGEDHRGLVVRQVDRSAGEDQAPVAASFRFWMDQLADLYLPGAMSPSEEARASLMIRALVGALPGGPSPTADQAENLKSLRTWIEDNRFGNLEAALPVLHTVLAMVRGEGVFQHENLESYERRSLESLEAYYVDLQKTARGE